MNDEVELKNYVDLGQIYNNASNTIAEYTNKINELIDEMANKIKSDIAYKYNLMMKCPCCLAPFDDFDHLINHYHVEHYLMDEFDYTD